MRIMNIYINDTQKGCHPYYSIGLIYLSVKVQCKAHIKSESI